SYIIIAANILIFFFLTQTHTAPYEALSHLEEIVEHIDKHPDVELSPALREVLSEHFLEDYDEAKRRSQEAADKLREDGLTGGLAHLDRLTNNIESFELLEAQDELDRLTEELLALARGGTYQRYGYIPSREGHYYTLVTTMFLHGGLMHLFGNMLLFFLCGPFVEDRWGRVLFTLFYLASGVAATLCHGLLTTFPDIPLVGASGAIAGVMGAFLILFFFTKIKFLYFFLLGFRFFKGSFQVPSYVVLPLWFAQQYYNAMTLENSPVAFWAHVGGFACGFVIAGVMKLTSLEERYISPNIDRQITYYEAPPLLEEAMEKWSQGQPQEAIEMLNRILRQTPHDTHAMHALFQVYCSMDDTAGIQKIGSRLIDTLLKENQLDQAKETFKHMKINDSQVLPTPKTLFNMATAFENSRETKNAYKAYEKIAVNYPYDLLALKSLVKLAKYYLEVEQDYMQAFEYFVLAKHHPAADSSVTAMAVEGIEQSRHHGGPEVAEMDEADVEGFERYEELVSP
ncbi:MAG: hypothetical protein ETSY1_29230, partial [Candidatus Entotheonella factor]